MDAASHDVTDVSQPRWWIRASWPRLEPGAKELLVEQIDDFIVPPRFEAIAVRNDDRSDFDHGHPVGSLTITMQIQVEGRRPVIRELTISSQPTDENDSDEPNGSGTQAEARRSPRGGRPITAVLLRELPLARLARYAMLGIAYRLPPANQEEVPKNPEEVVPRELRDDAGFYRIGPDGLADDHGIYYIDTPGSDDLWSGQMEMLAAYAASAVTSGPRRHRISEELLTRVAAAYREAHRAGLPPRLAVERAEHVSQATAGRYIALARARGHLRKTSPGKKGEDSE